MDLKSILFNFKGKLIKFFKFIIKIPNLLLKNKIKILKVLILILLVSLSFYFGKNYFLKNTPKKTVKNFLTAIEKKNYDKALTYIDSQTKSQFEMNMKFLSTISKNQNSTIEIKYSNLKFTTLEENESRAKVKVTGKVQSKILGEEKKEDCEFIFELIKKNNKRYISKTLNL